MKQQVNTIKRHEIMWKRLEKTKIKTKPNLRKIIKKQNLSVINWKLIHSFHKGLIVTRKVSSFADY